jgi:sugar phosphate isomerase/epimerase
MVPSLTLEYTIEGSWQDRMDAIRRAGFAAVNLYSGICKHLMQSVSSETKRLKSQIRHRNLAVDWVHAPYVQPILYDSEIEKASVSVGALKHAVTIAAELEARSLVVHPMGIEFPMEVDQGACLDQLLHAFSVLVDYGQEYGVQIAVENIDEPFSTRILKVLFDQIQDLTLCFDTGHAHHWHTWDAYIPDHIERISALHIHDNHGQSDQHLIPGDGNIDFTTFFKALKSHGYNGYLGLECVQRIGSYSGGCPDLAETIRERLHLILDGL